MDLFLTLFGVVVLAFAFTNMDNLLLLIGWQRRRVAALRKAGWARSGGRL